MKNFKFYFQILLVLSVVYLYYLHFSYKSGLTEKYNPIVSGKSSSGLVYVNVDTLLENYDLYKKLKSDFEDKQKSAEADIESKKVALSQEYELAQSKAKGGMMTELQMQQAEEKLMKKQQDLVEYQRGEEQKLGEENQRIIRTVYSNISGYLKKLNETANYQFVFGFTNEGGILLANDSLNITKFVLEGINKEGKN